jgi:hypothetical protein
MMIWIYTTLKKTKNKISNRKHREHEDEVVHRSKFRDMLIQTGVYQETCLMEYDQKFEEYYHVIKQKSICKEVDETDVPEMSLNYAHRNTLRFCISGCSQRHRGEVAQRKKEYRKKDRKQLKEQMLNDVFQ